MKLINVITEEEIAKIHSTVIYRMRQSYENLEKLETGNSILHTKIYTNISNGTLQSKAYTLERYELPILDCLLESSNYILMTTEKMYSQYYGKNYIMEYTDFHKYDWNYCKDAGKDKKQKTSTLRYLSITNNEFIYEIDSYVPAGIANKIIVQLMINIFNAIKSGNLNQHLSDESW